MFNSEQWEDALPAMLWDYQSKKQASTGKTSYEVMFGIKPPFPKPYLLPIGATHKVVKKRTRKVVERKHQLNPTKTTMTQRLRNFNLPVFKIGQEVFKHDTPLKASKLSKFIIKWCDPFKIYKVGPHYSYYLEDFNG